jgi:hypothetical protein
MSLSKKDYIAISMIISKEVNHWEGQEAKVNSAICSIVDGLVDYFQKENPRFNKEIFCHVCDICGLELSDMGKEMKHL